MRALLRFQLQQVKIAGMRRFVIILMLFVLPLQASWGAFATYKSHGKAASVNHAAQYDAASESSAIAGSPADKTPVGFDGDCAVCHLAHHSNVILPPIGIVAPQFNEVPSQSFTPTDTFIRSLPSPRPERPKWSTAV